ncbi:MAG TPA: hypothetical protein VF223_19110 [Trebonia sp.]
MAIPPGSELWSSSAPLTVAASPLVTPWFPTDGFLKVVLAWVFTNSTGGTTMTIEGSGDAVTQDTTLTYAALSASPQTVPVLHRYIRFRLVQATANATATSVFAKTSN